jgi:hypothetical protein
MTTTNNTTTDFSDRFIDASRKAGHSYVDAYEKTLTSIADYQDRIGKTSQVDWIATLAHAQADFTRNWAEAYTTAARSVLK